MRAARRGARWLLVSGYWLVGAVAAGRQSHDACLTPGLSEAEGLSGSHPCRRPGGQASVSVSGPPGSFGETPSPCLAGHFQALLSLKRPGRAQKGQDVPERTTGPSWVLVSQTPANVQVAQCRTSEFTVHTSAVVLPPCRPRPSRAPATNRPYSIRLCRFRQGKLLASGAACRCGRPPMCLHCRNGAADLL